MPAGQKAKILLKHFNLPVITTFFNPLTASYDFKKGWAGCRPYSKARLGRKITQSKHQQLLREKDSSGAYGKKEESICS